MPASTTGRMVGRIERIGCIGCPPRSGVRFIERQQLLTDIADELIAEHAITPIITDESGNDWASRFDDWAVDPFPHEDLDDIDWDPDEIDDAGTPITDQDIPGGWGTGFAWEDLQTLTITKRPYLWSTGKEAST